MVNETRPSHKPDIDFEKEPFEAAVNLRGTVAPADYKHCVLSLLFLRYLSLRYEQRRQELQRLIREPGSEYYVADARLVTEITDDIIDDPDEYRKVNAFLLPEEATWDYIRRNARADDIKIRLDGAMDLLEGMYPQLHGVLHKVYAGSNLDNDNVAGLERADISILDESFLAGFKPGRNTDLQPKLLEKLVEDEIRLRRRSNLARYRSFQEMLEDALRRYHNNTIPSRLPKWCASWPKSAGRCWNTTVAKLSWVSPTKNSPFTTPSRTAHQGRTVPVHPESGDAVGGGRLRGLAHGGVANPPRPEPVEGSTIPSRRDAGPAQQGLPHASHPRL